MITKEQAMKVFNNECQCCTKDLTDDIRKAHFHHLRSYSKKANMSDLFGHASTEKTLKELAKCTLLCEDCHKNLHKILGKKVYKKQSLQYIAIYKTSLN